MGTVSFFLTQKQNQEKLSPPHSVAVPWSRSTVIVFSALSPSSVTPSPDQNRGSSVSVIGGGTLFSKVLFTTPLPWSVSIMTHRWWSLRPGLWFGVVTNRSSADHYLRATRKTIAPWTSAGIGDLVQVQASHQKVIIIFIFCQTYLIWPRLSPAITMWCHITAALQRLGQD